MVRLIVPNGDRKGERAPRGGAAGYRVPTPLSLRGLRATLVLRTVRWIWRLRASYATSGFGPPSLASAKASIDGAVAETLSVIPERTALMKTYPLCVQGRW